MPAPSYGRGLFIHSYVESFAASSVKSVDKYVASALALDSGDALPFVPSNFIEPDFIPSKISEFAMLNAPC